MILHSVVAPLTGPEAKKTPTAGAGGRSVYPTLERIESVKSDCRLFQFACRAFLESRAATSRKLARSCEADESLANSTGNHDFGLFAARHGISRTLLSREWTVLPRGQKANAPNSGRRALTRADAARQ